MWDNGIGIDEKELELLATPFYALHKNKGGTGLGLAICKRIVEGHGGSLHITSTRGFNTTISIVLPSAS